MAIERGINIPEAVINTEWRVIVLEHLVDRIISAIPPGTVTPKDMERWRGEALDELKKKYPAAGLSRTQRVHIPPDLETR